MLHELTLTPASAAILAALAAWTIWAVRRLFKRGMCDCGDKRDGCSGKAPGASACSHCGAAADVVARMESSLR